MHSEQFIVDSVRFKWTQFDVHYIIAKCSYSKNGWWYLSKTIILITIVYTMTKASIEWYNNTAISVYILDFFFYIHYE